MTTTRESARVTIANASSGDGVDGVGDAGARAIADVADVEMPKFDFSDVAVPDVGLESLSDGLDNLRDAATTNGVDASAVETEVSEFGKEIGEAFGNVNVPKFDVPKMDLPKFDASKYSVPKVDIPKVDIPKVEVDLSGYTKSLNSATSEYTKSLNSATSEASKSFNDAAGAASKSFNDAAGTASKSFNDVAGTVTKSLNEGKAAIDGSIKGAQDTYNALTASVNSTVSDTVTGAVTTVKASLPEEFANLVDAAKDDADIAIVLGAAGFAGVFAVGATIEKIRGFAGSKTPQQVLDQLTKNKKAFIIDTRSLELRKRDGVPDLTGKARDKGSAVPVEELDTRTRANSRNPREVELKIAAEKVMKLTKRGAQVYFMGPDGAALAKTVTAMGGRKCFTVSGDFAAWRSAGLKIRRSPKYEKNAAEVIGEETAEFARSTTMTIKTSVGTTRAKVTDTYQEANDAQRAVILLGFVALACGVIQYEKSLQFVGFMGVFASAAARVTGTQGRYDFFDDAGAFAGSGLKLIQGATGFAGSITSVSARLVKAASSKKEASDMKVASLAEVDFSMPEPEQAEETEETADVVDETVAVEEQNAEE